MTDEEGFESWWKLYPKKCAKGDARKAWKQTQKIRPPLNKMLTALYAARASKQWHKEEGEYIPYPASYLRAERWDDQHEVNLAELETPSGNVCAYCAKPWTTRTNGKWACDDHLQNALANEKGKVVSIGTKPQEEPVVDKKLESCGS